MKITLDQETIQIINLFRNLTGSNVVDCVDADEDLYFVIAEGQYGLAVGKNGVKIKHAEKVFKKNIKVFEYSTDMMQFIRNLIPEASEINQVERIIHVKVKQNLKAKVIGKNGKNIKVINEILKRHFDIDALKVK
jgi:N utilization substance protein A